MFGYIFHPTHLLLVVLIALIIFGPGKLGDLGGALGKTIKEFKGSLKKGESKNDQAKNDQAKNDKVENDES